MVQEDVSVLVVKIERVPTGIIIASGVVQNLANDYDIERMKIN